MEKKYRVIYQPSGAALEYAPLACNIYIGCQHGCRYCYAPRCLKKNAENFHASRNPRPDILKNLELDLMEMRKNRDGREVLFCFVSDPYSEKENPLTRESLRLMRQYNHPFCVLTKGGMRAASDFNLYREMDSFASTLTFDNDADSMSWEPLAALPDDRMAALKTAHDMGISTWVSFEPVLNPDQVMRLLIKTLPFVAGYKVGKASGYHYTEHIDWTKFVAEFSKIVKENGKNLLIKHSLKGYEHENH